MEGPSRVVMWQVTWLLLPWQGFLETCFEEESPPPPKKKKKKKKKNWLPPQIFPIKVPLFMQIMIFNRVLPPNIPDPPPLQAKTSRKPCISAWLLVSQRDCPCTSPTASSFDCHCLSQLSQVEGHSRMWILPVWISLCEFTWIPLYYVNPTCVNNVNRLSWTTLI